MDGIKSGIETVSGKAVRAELKMKERRWKKES